VSGKRGLSEKYFFRLGKPSLLSSLNGYVVSPRLTFSRLATSVRKHGAQRLNDAILCLLFVVIASYQTQYHEPDAMRRSRHRAPHERTTACRSWLNLPSSDAVQSSLIREK
jgi:hypothetical protein